MLHYFHPKMGTGEIATDSLILSPTASLIADPSAQNFERCVNDMLSRINDPSTQLQKKSISPSSLLFTPDPYKSAVHKLPNDIWYFAFPTAATKWDDPFSMPGLMASQWDSAKAIIFDLRNVNNPFEDGLDAFQYYLPRFVANYLGIASLPEVFERSIYHNGFLSQGIRQFNGYSGWKTTTTGGLPILPPIGKRFQKPLLIVLNSHSRFDFPIALKAIGLCKIVFEGSEADYPVGKMIRIDLSDSLIVNLRVSDMLVGDNQTATAPDWRVDRITDTSLSGTFIKKCMELLREEKEDASVNKKNNLSLRFVPPMPERYMNELFPSAEKRLFAVYNWWNAIQYFYPYKHLIGRNWDSVLTRYITPFLQANDSLAYNLALMNLTSEINDSHGALYRLNVAITPYHLSYSFAPPIAVEFIENKLIVTNKTNDSLQDMTKLQLWDEITHIDGKTIKEVKEEWRGLFSCSNESAFLRDLPYALLTGLQNSTIKLGVLRNGKNLSINLLRSGKYFDRLRSLSDQYPSFRFLEKEIGYINMNKLASNEADSAVKVFKNTKAIIFDLRKKVEGGAVIPSLLTCVQKRAAIYEKSFVTYSYIHGGWDSSILVSYNTIIPADPSNCYKGKVIVLVNANTQSAGEFRTMRLQAAADATVIGSQTAGADGAIREAVFPGGYVGVFTGDGIKYPDGRQTQRIGIRVDIEVTPTIAGLKAGKDEVLLRALEFIKKGK